MNHSTIYRICLLSVVILTIIGGIFYYMNYVKNQTAVTEGTLVEEMESSTENFCPKQPPVRRTSPSQMQPADGAENARI